MPTARPPPLLPLGFYSPFDWCSQACAVARSRAVTGRDQAASGRLRSLQVLGGRPLVGRRRSVDRVPPLRFSCVAGGLLVAYGQSTLRHRLAGRPGRRRRHRRRRRDHRRGRRERRQCGSRARVPAPLCAACACCAPSGGAGWRGPMAGTSSAARRSDRGPCARSSPRCVRAPLDAPCTQPGMSECAARPSSVGRSLAHCGVSLRLSV